MINMATSDNTLYSKCKKYILLVSRMSHPKLYICMCLALLFGISMQMAAYPSTVICKNKLNKCPEYTNV